MYQQYFGLSEAPFSIAPDPRYLFLSDKHREALAHLIYGVGDQGGFVVLTGEVGTGKTTICRCLLQQIPDNVDIAFIINPKQSINQLLQSVFSDLAIPYEAGITSKDLIDQLNVYLLNAHAQGRNTILIIDEAQNLSSDVLEQLRLLTNLETNEKKLLQLVLLGQPELNDLLAKPELRQLAQRVTARFHLSPLLKSEVTAYIEHRLSVAGCRSALFPPSAIRNIYRLSNGVPRLINLICDRCLLGVYATSNDQVTAAIVANAAKEIFPHRARFHWRPVWLAIAVAMLIFLVSYSWRNNWLNTHSNVIAQATTAPATITPATTVSTTTVSTTTASATTASTTTAPPVANPAVINQGWLADLAQQDKPQQALDHLYALWYANVDFNQVDDCLQAYSRENSTDHKISANKITTRSVYCINNLQSIDQIQRYNSPAVVALKTGPDKQGYLLIKSIVDSIAQIIIAGREYQIELNQLTSLPVVDSFLLTRIPATYQLPIHPGDSGAAVAELQTLIAEYTNQQPIDLAQGRAAVDSDANQLRNKIEFLYAHYLTFDTLNVSENYSLKLQERVKQAQQILGVEATAIVDIAFFADLQHKINNTDPVLNNEQRIDRQTVQEG